MAIVELINFKYLGGLLNVIAFLVCSKYMIYHPSMIFYGLKDHVRVSKFHVNMCKTRIKSICKMPMSNQIYQFPFLK